MIKLIKGNTPVVLQNNGFMWTKALMNFARSNPGTKIPDKFNKHYNKPDIKDAVKLETHGKCMYCESQITHQYAGDIEHIIPKKHYPRLTFTWKNLSFACWWCNHNKSDFVDKSCKLLNPYNDNIDEHIRSFGPIIMQIGGSKRGEITVKTIKLNRPDLLEKRKDELDKLQNLIDKYHSESNQSLKQILYQELISNAVVDQEYSLCKKQYLEDQEII